MEKLQKTSGVQIFDSHRRSSWTQMTRYSLIEDAVACGSAELFVHPHRATYASRLLPVLNARRPCRLPSWQRSNARLSGSKYDALPLSWHASTIPYSSPAAFLQHDAMIQRGICYSRVCVSARLSVCLLLQSLCDDSASCSLQCQCDLWFIIMQCKARIKYEAMKGDLTKSTHRSHLEVSFVLINRAIQDKIGDCNRAVKCLKLRRCKMPQWRSKQQHAARLGIRLDITHRACW